MTDQTTPPRTVTWKEFDEVRKRSEWTKYTVLGIAALIGFLGTGVLFKWFDQRGPAGAAGPAGPAGSAGTSTPIGSVIAWPGKLEPGKDLQFPDGSIWRICDGTPAPISGEDDPLFKALGTNYGPLPSPREILLPNFQGTFLRGAGSQTLGNTMQTSKAVGESQDQSPLHALIGSPGPTLIQIHKWQHSVWRGKPEDRVLAAENRNGSPQEISATKVAPANSTGNLHPANYAVHWIIRVK